MPVLLWWPFVDISSAHIKLGQLLWRHNGRDGVSNHQPHDCLLNRSFRRRSKKHQSSASLAFVWGIHRGPVNSPHKWPVARKMFPLHDVIMGDVTMGLGIFQANYVKIVAAGALFYITSHGIYHFNICVIAVARNDPKCEYLLMFPKTSQHVTHSTHLIQIEISRGNLVFREDELERFGSYKYRKVIWNPIAWWLHQMDIFSALLVFCEGNPPVICGYPSEQTAEQMIETPVIWDAIIMTSLYSIDR